MTNWCFGQKHQDSKLVQTCSNLFIFTLLGEPDDNNGADEDEILVDGISRPRNSDSRNGEGLIKLRQFATVPHLPRNVQSRGNFYFILFTRSIFQTLWKDDRYPICFVFGVRYIPFLTFPADF